MPPHLFQPLSLRSLTLPNRIGVSPMCQYSSQDGLANPWHLVHLGSRAIGGAGLVFTEAAAVSPEGRISPQDLGLWNQAQADSLAPIVQFIRAQGAVAGIQLAHAGRKASTYSPFSGHSGAVKENGWQVVAPSEEPFAPHYPRPQALAVEALPGLLQQFTEAASRAAAIGFELLELHMAHGYLLHEFLSPLSNQRSDEFGGSLPNRMRFPLQVARAVRAVWPDSLPLSVRISATDWHPDGWQLADSLEFARELKALGVDLIDCSSGGAVPKVDIPLGPGYQVQFAEAVRREIEVPTAAVGLITEPEQAERIVSSGQADVVLLAREMLRDPYWPRHAAHALRHELRWPPQYERAALPLP